MAADASQHKAAAAAGFPILIEGVFRDSSRLRLIQPRRRIMDMYLDALRYKMIRETEEFLERQLNQREQKSSPPLFSERPRDLGRRFEAPRGLWFYGNFPGPDPTTSDVFR
jgi:hypothetical protein